MKKDFIYAPILLAVGVVLFLLRATGLPVHITVSVVGMFVLAIYTAATKKTWKLPALELIMRACYGIALITVPIVMKIKNIVALPMIGKKSEKTNVAYIIVQLQNEYRHTPPVAIP